VFILYAVVGGVLAGLVAGGRLDRLAALPFRLGWLAAVALAIQVALFSPLATTLSADVSRLIYVASTAAVVAVVLANLRLTGVPIVVAGALANLAAIAANGGAMPASEGALATAGQTVDGPTNSVLVAHPVLEPLTDIFAVPAWLPLANVFSIGDVLIGIGIAVVIVAGMRPLRRSS
jgi:hypothetical protein